MARDLGCTIGELGERMSFREFKQWQAQYEFEAELRERDEPKSGGMPGWMQG